MKPTRIVLCLHKDEEAFPSDKNYEIDNNDNNTLVYYNIDEDTYMYNKKLYKSITYLIYYKENYAIGLFGIMKKNKFLGYHHKDIERIKILYDPITFKEEYVYMSSYKHEGKWIEWEKCDKIFDKLLIYVSKYSHANYSKPGIKWRMFGFANDYCSNRYNAIILYPSLIKDESILYIPDQISNCSFLKRFLKIIK